MNILNLNWKNIKTEKIIHSKLWSIFTNNYSIVIFLYGIFLSLAFIYGMLCQTLHLKQTLWRKNSSEQQQRKYTFSLFILLLQNTQNLLSFSKQIFLPWYSRLTAFSLVNIIIFFLIFSQIWDTILLNHIY